jgi:hypothetical protein
VERDLSNILAAAFLEEPNAAIALSFGSIHLSKLGKELKKR